LERRRALRGDYHPPADKSITHRALLLSAIAEGTSTISNPLSTGDCLSTLKALKTLGVSISVNRRHWTVRGGRLQKPKSRIDCENSGTTMRLLAGILSSQNFDSILVGDRSLSKRPMKRILDPLRSMGAKLSAREGLFAPLKISGSKNLKPVKIKIPVASAQVKSSILLAGLSAKGTTTVIEPTKSRDHTERMLSKLGAKIHFSPEGRQDVPNLVSIHGPQVLKSFHLKVPGDFSSAAFFIAGAAILPDSRLIVRNVSLNPTRIGFLKVLERMGSDIRCIRLKSKNFEPVGDIEIRTRSLKATKVTAGEVPLMIDELPILAVVASQARGKTVIRGAGELRVKETDRISAVASELGKLGARITELSDGFIIEGPTPLRGAVCKTFGDHRIAMALAIAGLIAKGITTIQGFSCIDVSYPNFLNDLNALQRSV